LIGSALGLYASFLNWGYLQERLSSTDYSFGNNEKEGRWTYVIVLNCLMATICCLTALVFLSFSQTTFSKKPDVNLALVSLSHTLASPFGYLSLRYINYPMLLLVKSSKLVPVMLLSYLLNGKKYSFKQMASVALISLGVALFSCKINPMSFASTEDTKDGDQLKTLIGFSLVCVNLLLDGFTNARQDKYRDSNTGKSSFDMMYQLNIWQMIYMISYLSFTQALAKIGIIPQHLSQLSMAYKFMSDYPSVIRDVFLFSTCGAIGQIFIFYIITNFGSLMCVLITVTRKFFSILLSVVIFGHVVMWWQWCGVIMVFSGLLLNSLEKYYQNKQLQHKKKE